MGRVCHGPNLLWAEMSRNRLVHYAAEAAVAQE